MTGDRDRRPAVLAVLSRETARSDPVELGRDPESDPTSEQDSREQSVRLLGKNKTTGEKRGKKDEH